MSAICPECDSDIDIDEADVDIGDELTCSECGSLLQIVHDSPLELEAIDEDDLDDDDEEEKEEKDEDSVEEEDEDADDDDDGFSDDD